LTVEDASMSRRQWKETTWQRCADPERMLRYVRDRGASERKVRLFLAACCRACWERFTTDGSRSAIEVAERYTEDEEGSGTEFFRANKAAHRVPEFYSDEALYTICCLLCDNLDLAVAAADILAPPQRCALLREVFAPCRESSFDPAWRQRTVLLLAEAAYRQRSLPSGHLDVERLGVLADALSDVGCADDTLLSHLRSAGPHVRGCWALDLVFPEA
jgi:hypothetical protein